MYKFTLFLGKLFPLFLQATNKFKIPRFIFFFFPSSQDRFWSMFVFIVFLCLLPRVHTGLQKAKKKISEQGPPNPYIHEIQLLCKDFYLYIYVCIYIFFLSQDTYVQDLVSITTQNTTFMCPGNCLSTFEKDDKSHNSISSFCHLNSNFQILRCTYTKACSSVYILLQVKIGLMK